MEGCLRKLFICQSVKRFRITSGPRILLGISLCGATGYMLYLLLKKRRDIDETDAYSDTYVIDEEYGKLVIQVPRKYVPYIIGRKGQKIRELEENTGTKISFDCEINDENSCDCTIRGLLTRCEQAQYAIEKVMEEAPIISTESFAVARVIAPNVVGKYLENLRFIQDMSGSKLWLSDDTGGELRIFIRVHQIKNATIRVNTLIYEEKLRHEILEEKLSLRLPRFSPISDTVPARHIQQYYEKLTPALSNGLIEVYVSAVMSPSRFVVQIVGPKANELDLLVELMTEYYIRLEAEQITVEVDDIIAVPYEHDDKWYRAKVLSLHEDYVEVYYVDYGDYGIVPYTKLRELTAEYMALPYQGIECFLAQVVPAGDEWTEEAIDAFAALTHVAQWIKLIARVHRYGEPGTDQRVSSTMPGIDLYEVTPVCDINIARELIRDGHALLNRPSSRYPSKFRRPTASEPVTKDNEPVNFEENTPQTTLNNGVPKLNNS
ncbi:papi [Carabus blaptoides fortunei]